MKIPPKLTEMTRIRPIFNSVSSRLEELGYDLVGKILEDLALISDPYDRVKLGSVSLVASELTMSLQSEHEM